MMEYINKNKDSVKGKGDFEDIVKKCFEIYQPPGTINLKKHSIFDREPKVSNEIRTVMPRTEIQIRRKEEEKQLGAAGFNSSERQNSLIGSNNGVQLNKKVSINKQTTNVPAMNDFKQNLKQTLHQLEKEFIDIKTEKVNANSVNFEALYQENLPQAAVDLDAYLRGLKQNENSSQVDIGKTQKKWSTRREQVLNLIPKDKILPFYLLVQDVLEDYKPLQKNS